MDLKEAVYLAYNSGIIVIPENSKLSKESILGILYNRIPIRKGLYGLSNSYLIDLFNQVLPGKEKGVRYHNHVLRKLNLKLCFHCEEVLPFQFFMENKSKSDGKQVYCQLCHYETTKKTQTARSAKYRASKLLRTPGWSETAEIAEFYYNCPKDCHVDHIIPLQGETVSGLHVLGNLQYLLIGDNLTKSNKFSGL
jgi:hypothetical protein